MKEVQELPLTALAPGMVVATEVLDENERLLIPKGAKLTEGLIASLSRREIDRVWVEIEREEDPAETEAYRAKVAERLNRVFRHAGKAPETIELYQVILDYRTETRT